MRQPTLDRIKLLQSLACYTFSLLSTEDVFKGLIFESPLKWRTIGIRAHELGVSLKASFATPRLIKNRTYPALLSAQIQAIRNVLDALLSSEEKVAVKFAAQNVPHSMCDDIRTATTNVAKKATRNLVTNLLESLGNDRVLAYAACIEIACVQWQGPEANEEVSDELFREIRFAPEHRQAGIAILSYFSVILEQKLPNVDATVSITQQQDRVILTVSYPDGTQEKISQALSDYGLVVHGELQPEKFLDNPLHVIALKHKLELCSLELRQARDLHQLERTQTSKRLESLESEVAYLRQNLAAQMNGGVRIGHDLLAALREVISVPLTRDSDYLIERLIEAIIRKDEVALRSQVEKIGTENPSLLEQLHSFVLSSIFGGSIGNAAYEWLKMVWPLLPK